MISNSSLIVSLTLFTLKVKELRVEILANEICPLPPLLFTLKTLEDLRLSGNFIINAPDLVYLPQLKTLHLKEVLFCNDDSAQRLFSHCPVLEDLNIWRCDMGNIRVLNSSVPLLKKFMFYGNEGVYGIVLNAANLEEMYYSEMTAYVQWQSGNILKSLVKAFVCIKHDFYVPELVNRICDVKFLALSGGSVKGLHDRDGNFLEVAHYLPDPIPKCVSDQLKEVNVGYFHGNEYEFRMVEYFLMNAKVLEKIIISPSPPWYTGYEYCMKDQFLITKKLLNLQRCSRSCRIVFTDEVDLLT